MIEYNLLRSNRRTIAIYITRDAKLEVRAPFKMSKAGIDEFLNSKEGWIKEHLCKKSLQVEKRTTFALNYGDMVLLQGKEYPIRAKAGNGVGFDHMSFYIPPNLNNDEIKYAVIQIYKMIAKQIITSKVRTFSAIMKLIPTSIKINSAKTRWGSCSGKNNINFSWRLVLAGDESIDYVVVHELAHIKEHNHSNRFWAIVKAVLPDYKQREQGLKVLQDRLCNEDWE